MKTFVYDFNNLGIIYVSTVQYPLLNWELHILKSCILDISIGRIHDNAPLYKELNNDTITKNFYAVGTGGVVIGDMNEVNSLYLSKQAKIKLIMPLIKLLASRIYTRSINQIYPFAVPIDDTICFEVLNSDPTTNYYSPGIIEYASCLDITPRQAYQELKLEYETIHSIKMRSFAMTKKYQALIREVSTEEQAAQLHAEIEQKLFKDTFI